MSIQIMEDNLINIGGRSLVKKKELVAYCGLYCEDCVKYKGNIQKLSGELLDQLDSEKFEKVASTIKEIKDYKDFRKTLEVLNELECKEGCRAGGGTPDCVIRLCCQDKGFYTCAECDKFMYCPELAGMPAIQCGIISYVKELQRIKEIGLEKWLAE
jgi:hypothetical protein